MITLLLDHSLFSCVILLVLISLGVSVDAEIKYNFPRLLLEDNAIL